MKWYATQIYLLLELIPSPVAHFIDRVLSSNMEIGPEGIIHNSDKKILIQVQFLDASKFAIYSASLVNDETIG